MKRLLARGVFLRRLQPGFTLAELAIVLVIVALLLGGTMAMVSSQTDQRSWNDTQSRLEAARDAILGFAISNGRLPCPAIDDNVNSKGVEVRQASGAYAGACGALGNNPATNLYDYYGGVVSGVTYGLLPALTVGYQPVDTRGFALDAWGNRIRYAVSATSAPNFTDKNTMRANTVSTLPNDLVVCASATGIVSSPPSCGTAASVTNQNTVVAILYSPGKNGRASITLGADEAANENRAGANDAVFISHPPAPATAANGEFDDQLLWISAYTLYGKLIAAWVLP